MFFHPEHAPPPSQASTHNIPEKSGEAASAHMTPTNLGGAAGLVDLCLWSGLEKHIGGLEIRVQNPQPMQIVHAHGHIQQPQQQSLLVAHRAGFQAVEDSKAGSP
jgi:hypothetical protein